MTSTRSPIFIFPLFSLTFATASCTIDPPPPDLVRACDNLFAQREAYDRACTGATDIHPAAGADSCVGIATSPGSTLKAADIDACAAALGASDCSAYPSCVGYGANLLFPAHDRKGSGLAGEACFANVQCESGYCSARDDSCGFCQAARDLGESCSGLVDECVRGWCTGGVCRLPGKAEGEACIDYGGGDCQETLFCETPGPSGIDGVCVARGGAGAACADARTCAEGLLCSGSICAAPLPDGAACGDEDTCAGYCDAGTCAKIPFGLAEGESCAHGYCRSDLVCEEGSCKVPVGSPEGSACPPFSSSCESGLLCEAACVPGPCASSGVCVAAPAAGALCAGFGQCAAGAVCIGFAQYEGQRGVCVKLGGEGDACPCLDELACVEGACIAYGAAICD